jgi:hypothetical protein
LASSRTLALGLLLLWGCGGGGDGGGDCDPIAATLVSRIEVTPPAASVADGESVQLTAKAYSCDGSLLAAPTFTWQSSDVTTVSVSTSGMAVGVKLGGPVAIKAVAQGKEGAAQVSVVPRAVASVRVEPATANVATGRTSTLVAKAFDAQGNELPGQTATWSSGNEAIVTVSQTGAITGVVPGGPVTVTATIEGHSGAAQVTVVEAAVASVTVSPAETNVQAGSTIQLTAVLKDDQGNILTGRAILWTTSDAVRTSVSNTGVVSGLALGGPATIVATSEGRSGSSLVTVVPGAASRLAFTVQPRNVAAGASISPDVKVEVQDAGGNRISTSTAPVTMSLGTNPGGATLSGTRTVNAVAGVATFTDLRINRVGNGYTLSAASPGLTDAVSSTFNVTPGAAATMRFGVQPSDVVAGAAISPAITVELLDAQGNIATGAAPQVSLSLGNNPGGATLSGTTTVAAVAGVATFTGLNLNAVGAGYTLVAASAGLPVVASAGFTVTAGAPATLSFITQPGSTVAGASISPAVQLDLRDAQGNLVTTPTQVTISLGNNPGGATLGGTLTVSTVGGVATFEGLTMDVVGAGYTLSAAAAGLTATSTPFDVTPGPATQLAFLVQPTDINENLPFTPDVAVEVRDAFGNRVTGFAGSVSLQLRSATGGGAGTGNQLVGGVARPFVQGVAVFTDMTVNFTSIVLATRTFTLRTQNSIAVVSSTPFTVSPF